MQLTSALSFVLLTSLALAAPLPADSANTASSHLVASLGSSYSAGLGLDQPYGKILADMLAKQAGLPAPFNNYHNYAVSGTNVTSVPDNAKKLQKQKYAAVAMTAGGNDLNYVTCLGSQHRDWCGKTIDQTEFVKRYTTALDSIIENVDSKTPIYVVTYTQALGANTACASSNDANSLCNLTSEQAKVAKGIYTNLIEWTVAAYDQWKKDHPSANIKMITMWEYSKDKHDVGAKAPWVNGSKKPAQGDGAVWHPNKAGAQFIAQAIYNDINNLPVPAH